MSATTPAPAIAYTPYDYTRQGILERWTREKMEQRYDFQGAIERQGIGNAKRVMLEELEDAWQFCHNNAPSAR